MSCLEIIQTGCICARECVCERGKKIIWAFAASIATLQQNCRNARSARMLAVAQSQGEALCIQTYGQCLTFSTPTRKSTFVVMACLEHACVTCLHKNAKIKTRSFMPKIHLNVSSYLALSIRVADASRT